MKNLISHLDLQQSKIAVVVGKVPAFRELASHILRNQNCGLKIRAVDDFAALTQLAESLEKSIHLEKIIIYLTKNSDIDLVSKINKNFPGAAVLALVAFNAEDRLQSTIGADANSDMSRRGTSGSNALSGAAAKDKQFASPNLERGFLSPARPGIKPPHSAPLSLTQREQELLQLLHKGYSYASCAQAMNIGLSTVQTHIRNTYRKLSVTNNRQAILKAQSSGLLNF